MTNVRKRQIQGSSHASPEERQAELLQAAMTVFGKHGYHRTTVDAIALEARLSKGSVYRFFKTKDHILLAILDKFEEDIKAIIEGKIVNCESVLETLEITFRETLTYVAERSELLSVWLDFYRHPDAKARIKEMFVDSRKEYSDLFHHAIANGEIPEQPVEPMVSTLIAVNEGFLILTEVEENFDFGTHINGVWNVVKQGFLNPPPVQKKENK